MNKTSTHRSLVSVCGLLAACCLGLLPGGCGDSATAGADKRVKQASDEAARIANSAGAYRPTDAFTDKVKAAGWQTEGQTSLDSSLKGPLKGLKDAAAVDKYMATLLKKETVEQDLATAIKKLNDSLAGDAPSNGTFSLAQAQIGNTNGQLASAQMDDAAGAVLELVRKSVDVQALATEMNEFEAAAGVGESTKTAYQGALDATVNGSFKEAKDAADAAAADLKTKSDTLAGIQAQMSDKRKEGQEARVAAAEYLNKSNEAKGDDVLKYFQQSADYTAKAAAALSAATAMQPDLDVATVEQKLADVKATMTANSLKDVTDLKSQMEQTAAGADKIKQEAQNLLNQKQEALTHAVADFNTAADSTSALLGKIGALSKSSQESYQKAQGALDKYRTEISEQHRDVNDPVAKGVANKQIDDLFLLSTAAALNRSAQSHLLAADVVQMKEQVDAAKANRPVGVSEAVSNERKLALNDFQAAAGKVRPLTLNAPDLKGTPIVWIASLALAVSEEGSSLANTGAEVKIHHDLATRAAADAEAFNALIVVRSTAAVKAE